MRKSTDGVAVRSITRRVSQGEILKLTVRLSGLPCEDNDARGLSIERQGCDERTANDLKAECQ